MSLIVRFRKSTALDEINRRIIQLGILGSQVVFEANNNVAVSARVNVKAENELRFARAIRMIPQVDTVSKA